MSALYSSYPHYVATAYASNWAVADWYIDGTVGNDANDGLTAETPLQTGVELFRRLGPYAIWSQSVTIHVLANGMTDGIILRGYMPAGSHVDLLGTATVLATDTINTYTALNHTTPTATEITASESLTDFTPYKWRRLRITSGVRSGAVSWIAKESPGGVGVATARISPPIQLNTASNTNIVSTTIAFVNGDPFVIESLPTVPNITIELDGPIATTLIPQYAKRAVSIQNLDVPFLMLKGLFLGLRLKAPIFGNRLGNVIYHGPKIVESNHINGCSMAVVDPTSTATPLLDTQASFNNCLFGDGAPSIQLVQPAYFSRCLFQETRFLGNRPNVQVTAFDIQIFDCPASTSAMNHLFADMTNFSGSGNAGIGLNLNNGAFCRYTGVINLKGSISDAQLTQAPVTNLTLPQALQPDDYAQKGVTSAMVEGTITVTVPWYDKTVQRVTVSHSEFSGTPGVLSVQQISNTQFTVTSSSATDTSTVNWQISPLGRNIFISTS